MSGKKEVTPEFLATFTQAWNDKELDKRMAHMSDDCTFMASVGTDVEGTRQRQRDPGGRENLDFGHDEVTVPRVLLEAQAHTLKPYGIETCFQKSRSRRRSMASSSRMAAGFSFSRRGPAWPKTPREIRPVWSRDRLPARRQ